MQVHKSLLIVIQKGQVSDNNTLTAEDFVKKSNFLIRELYQKVTNIIHGMQVAKTYTYSYA